MTRLQRFRAICRELDECEQASMDRWNQAKDWWQEERNEIKRLRRLAKAEYSLRAERGQRLDQLNKLEAQFLEKYVQSILH